MFAGFDLDGFIQGFAAQQGFAFAQQQQQHQIVRQQNGPPPPTSRHYLNNLPMVKVTADDLQEANNKECLVCLEEQKLGEMACKLPCGHVFHRNCVEVSSIKNNFFSNLSLYFFSKEWLEKQCTCPVCRYEVPTDDVYYEQERKTKMKKVDPTSRSR